jgi:hypothetical protein
MGAPNIDIEKLLSIPEHELSWAAGFFDGEGNVNISQDGLQVSVFNTYKPAVDKFQEMFGGNITIRKGKQGKQRDCYMWFTSTGTAAMILRLLRPYLVVKQEQARIAIEFQSTKGYTRAKPSAEVVELRETLKNQLKAANQQRS